METGTFQKSRKVRLQMIELTIDGQGETDTIKGRFVVACTVNDTEHDDFCGISVVSSGETDAAEMKQVVVHIAKKLSRIIADRYHAPYGSVLSHMARAIGKEALMELNEQLARKGVEVDGDTEEDRY